MIDVPAGGAVDFDPAAAGEAIQHQCQRGLVEKGDLIVKADPGQHAAGRAHHRVAGKAQLIEQDEQEADR